jgi:predicted negative regulator of RcsB-dependent stress response
MSTLIVLLLVVVGGWVVWKLWKKPDANNDGVVNQKDAVVAVKEVAAEVKAHAATALDVNKDGKVDLGDAKAAAEKVKKGRKKKAV